MHNWQQSWRMVWRELRQGWRHFRVFLACLALGVAVMASVMAVGAAVDEALSRESRALLGGDIEARLTGNPATEEQLAFLGGYGEVSKVSTMRAMLQAEEHATLVEVKAIDDAYPLLGELKLQGGISREQAFTDDQLVVDEALLAQFDAKIGDKVRLGTAEYTLAATLAKEPDRAVTVFTFGPRVMLSHAALERSGLVSPFSLIRHHYRVLMDDASQVQAFSTALEKNYPDDNWRIQTGTDGNDRVARFTEQMEMFLTLSALATFLIAGIGIGSSVRAYLERKLPTLAILKTVGAPLSVLLQTYLLLLGVLACIGSAIGLAVAGTAIAFLLPIVSQWLPVVIEGSVFVVPFLLAFAVSLLIVYLFSLPALMGALQVRPALLFRSVVTHSLRIRPTRTLLGIEIVLGLCLLMILVATSRDPKVVLGGVGVALLAFALFALVTYAIRRTAARISVSKAWLRLALGNLYRVGSATGTVVMAIGMSLTVLVALTLTEANFQSRIKEIMTTEAPALFMIDIQPYQKEALEKMLIEASGSAEHVMVLPMARGRIKEVNGKEITPDDVGEEVRWAVRGDRGLSYSSDKPDNAELVVGEWWPDDYQGKPLISVDDRFLEGMGLEVGSTITLEVLGKEIEATVANARRIDYSSFQINFAMMLSPGVLDSFPHSYVATVHLSPEKLAANEDIQLLRQIVKAYPNITTIRTREAVSLVRDVIGHISTALTITVLISLLAGVLVLASSLGAMLQERLYDTAVLKVVGARRRDILKAYSVEWLLLGLATAVIAAAIGTFAAWLVMMYLPGEYFTFLPEVTLTTIAGCLVVVWVTGYVGNRQVFGVRPAGILRNE